MYGKHFASAYTGSMMAAGAHVFAVWGYIIANTVQGRVELNPRLLAALIGAGVVDIQKAIDYLAAPDPASRSKEHEGRRLIREGEYQYFVPNHEKYRSIRDEEGRREYNRQKKAEQREREKASKDVKPSVNMSKELSAQAEAEAEAEADKTHSLSITESGAACLAMRKHIPTVNPSDPRLKALIQAGTTVEEFEYAAQKAIGKANAFAYALKIVESRRQEAASIAANPGKEPKRARSSEMAEKVAQWTGRPIPQKEKLING